jgi:hypothetical protein
MIDRHPRDGAVGTGFDLDAHGRFLMGQTAIS